jgi:hypothetical protein
MDKRYQVFVSSTYADLKEERRAVIQAVIEQNGIPAGMELFPATDEEQLSFIKRVIDDCDYYLLIIAGRYGSVAADGISYTEKEYNYAVSRKLPVIALVHEDPEAIAHGKSEKDPVLSERLRQFREKVCTGRVVKFWRTADQLSGFVAQSLSSTMRQFPAVGWVRANKIASDPKMTFLAHWFATPQTSSEGLPAIVQRVAITNDSSVVAEGCELVIIEFSIAVPGLSMDTPLNIKDVNERKGDINRRSTRHFDLFFTYQTTQSESPHGTYVMAPNWPSIPWKDKEEVATIVLRLNGANFDPQSWKATVRLEGGKADIVEIKPTSPNLD